MCIPCGECSEDLEFLQFIPLYDGRVFMAVCEICDEESILEGNHTTRIPVGIERFLDCDVCSPYVRSIMVMDNKIDLDAQVSR